MGDTKYHKIKDEEHSAVGNMVLTVGSEEGEKRVIAQAEGPAEALRKTVVTIALTILTSSQGLLIALSKRSGHFNYSVTSANFMVEVTKCTISLASLLHIWQSTGITEDNRLSTNWGEIWVYPVPALLYLIKNLMQYFIFLYVDAPSYQILKNLNIISTGVLYRIFLKKRLSEVQWSALVLLALGCTIAQMNNNSDRVLSTPMLGVVLAVVMALLSGLAGVYTEMIIKKRPQRSIHVQNFYLYFFGILFNLVAICTYDYDAVFRKGFFAGYNWVTMIMILNHSLSGLAVSMVMKYANNIVKVYATSVAMLLTTIVSIPLFGFQLTLPFVLGTSVVCVAIFLHYQSKNK
uniref:Solute carrier family 35 (UDP-sugar transporter), member A1/2/3 n=1 Tax=Tetraselmis sp. GSL018 TaxID=582737 RepID=A0A061SAP7_9CHLO|eukprot:CAMPEP_0177596878 /NCGR_PEP_ID=MMETSP0419_2-20121207/11382_1 /TAXON_ID=582737 /ORGANISM="Tetraselmis sp., Strain GSL018" /LENGTH=347 /DNA_ID=CAMNT_0019088949 /DNA_START=191 /DNA_END=1234 /DNA_ORIENTATION=-